MLREMWRKLDAYTLSARQRSEREINVRNEWGGYSRLLDMPVFTGWEDRTADVDGRVRVLVSDPSWPNKAGVHNQEFWVEHALAHGGQAGCFLVKAADPGAERRHVESFDATRVLCGRVEREGDRAYVVPDREIRL